MAKAKADASVVLPPRLECMREWFTAAVVTAATRRVILGESLPESFNRAERKACLMLVREIAPEEVLCDYEEVVVRGVSKNTLTAMKQRGEIPQICGGIK